MPVVTHATVIEIVERTDLIRNSCSNPINISILKQVSFSSCHWIWLMLLIIGRNPEPLA